MIKIVAKNFVKPECLEEFKKLSAELVAGSQAEEGNIFYDLHQHTTDETVLTFIEAWKDQEAIDIHNASEHFTTIVPKLGVLCSKPCEVDLYTVL